MNCINFDEFIAAEGLKDGCELAQTSALIKRLSNEVCPNVCLINFPQSEMQAKFFVKNCVTPKHVFCLECSEDTSQARAL